MQGKIVIPARMGSSRFPGKPLTLIAGLPMIEHVRRRCLLVKGISEVWVATCDEPIKNAVESYGGKVIMTANTHQRPSERIAEAAFKLGGDYFIMVQGDEPLLNPHALEALNNKFLTRPAPEVVNLIHPTSDDGELESRNVVKVALSKNGKILFYSRSRIPNNYDPAGIQYYKQSGIIGFTMNALKNYVAIGESDLEKKESVDMLRFVENEIPIHYYLDKEVTAAVDSPEHVSTIEKELENNPAQKKLFSQLKNL